MISLSQLCIEHGKCGQRDIFLYLKGQQCLWMPLARSLEQMWYQGSSQGCSSQGCCPHISFLYGCETWTPYSWNMKQLDVFIFIAFVNYLDCLGRTVSWILLFFVMLVIQMQLWWTGHCLCMANTRIIKRIFCSELPQGMCQQVGEYKWYKHCLKVTLHSSNIVLMVGKIVHKIVALGNLQLSKALQLKKRDG